MKAENCFELGYISKAHGLAGEVQLSLDTETPEYYKELESVFIEINNKLIPFFIESISISGKKAIVKFEDMDHIDQASELTGKKAFLPLDLLPELEDDQFYYHEITGYTVIDTKTGKMGPVDAVIENPGHDLILMTYKEKEVIIPITDDIVHNIDRDKSEVYVTLPDGLLDLYLED